MTAIGKGWLLKNFKCPDEFSRSYIIHPLLFVGLQNEYSFWLPLATVKFLYVVMPACLHVHIFFKSLWKLSSKIKHIGFLVLKMWHSLLAFGKHWLIYRGGGCKVYICVCVYIFPEIKRRQLIRVICQAEPDCGLNFNLSFPFLNRIFFS